MRTTRFLRIGTISPFSCTMKPAVLLILHAGMDYYMDMFLFGCTMLLFRFRSATYFLLPGCSCDFLWFRAGKETKRAEPRCEHPQYDEHYTRMYCVCCYPGAITQFFFHADVLLRHGMRFRTSRNGAMLRTYSISTTFTT